METAIRKAITIEAIVKAPIEKVWKYWNDPEHVMQWNSAAADWHCPKAENDFRIGGTFSFTMAARDGSFSFDFGGTYTDIQENKRIDTELGDGRKVQTIFSSEGDMIKITETFEMENQNPEEMQRGGWQAILDNFKKYTEGAN